MGAPAIALAPGFHPGFSAHLYHADPCESPSLSSSIAKVLINETPKKAWLAHPRLNPDFTVEHDDKFNLGDSVHDFLSSGGERVRVIPGFTDYKKEGARIERDKLRAVGVVPLLEHQADQVNDIVAEVGKVLTRRKIDLGHQEAVFIAEDRGILLRSMMDSFNPPWITDFKVTGINLANDFVLGSHIADLGYDLSAWFYMRVAGLVFPEWAGRLKFRWVFIEKDHPHGVRIIKADATILEMGRRKGESALGIWQKCLASDRWPHLEHMPATVPYPNFKENAWLEREEKPDFIIGPQTMLKQIDDRRAAEQRGEL